uniref:CRAL-TRIO domain-containing protein n=1 Tax=Plectus sambesii TaxID=2011161 RepID=A0A914X9M5_9BILA
MAESAITPKERAMIEKLRDAVKDDLSAFYDTDYNLLRWLQGHNNDIDTVVHKLRCHLRFRKCWDLDNMHNRSRDDDIHSHWPDGLTGLSGKVDDAIVNVEQAGSVDYWGKMQTYSGIEVMKSRVYDLEMMLFNVMKHEKETGRQASIIYIMDLKDLQYSAQLVSLVTGPLRCLSQFMTDHYVELTKYFVFVNMPTFFYHIYRLAQPLIPERTRNKGRFLGPDWRREILDYSHPTALPDFWNIEGGESLFSANLKRPVKYDVEKYCKKAISAEHKLLSVAAGRTEFISVSVAAGAQLKWSVFTDGEFGFGVFYASDPAETDEMKLEMVYPQFHRVATPNVTPLEDSLLCEKAGVYKFWFDNKTAWWYPVKVHHKIRVD